MLAVILAAGSGTRLHPLTTDRSKAMLPIAGKPMIERVMAMLERGGAERFIIVTHPEDHAMHQYLRQRANRVRLAQQEQRLGMVHALECAAPLIREEGASSFLLASCDNLYPEGHVTALINHQREAELDAVLTLLQVPRRRASATAVVLLKDDRVTNIVEKPSPDELPADKAKFTGAPALYALSQRVIDYLPQVKFSSRNEREFPEALRLLIEDGGIVGGQRVEERMTLTHPKDLLRLNRYFLRQDPSCATIEAKMATDIVIHPPVRIEAGVEIGTKCHIGPEVYLEAGSRIGEGSRLHRAVVMRGATVEQNAAIADTVID